MGVQDYSEHCISRRMICWAMPGCKKEFKRKANQHWGRGNEVNELRHRCTKDDPSGIFDNNLV